MTTGNPDQEPSMIDDPPMEPPPDVDWIITEEGIYGGREPYILDPSKTTLDVSGSKPEFDGGNELHL